MIGYYAAPGIYRNMGHQPTPDAKEASRRIRACARTAEKERQERRMNGPEFHWAKPTPPRGLGKEGSASRWLANHQAVSDPGLTRF